MADDSKTGHDQRGFGSMDPDKRDIARKPDEKRSFAKDREHAGAADREEAQQSHSGNKPGAGRDKEMRGGGNFAADRGRAAEAGREGGKK